MVIGKNALCKMFFKYYVFCNAGKVSNQTDLYIYTHPTSISIWSTFAKTAQSKQPILESRPMWRTTVDWSSSPPPDATWYLWYQFQILHEFSHPFFGIIKYCSVRYSQLLVCTMVILICGLIFQVPIFLHLSFGHSAQLKGLEDPASLKMQLKPQQPFPYAEKLPWGGGDGEWRKRSEMTTLNPFLAVSHTYF